MSEIVSHQPRAYQLIGQLITRWSEVDEFIFSQTHFLQVQVYLRNKRAFLAQNPGRFMYPRVDYQIPDHRFKLRFRYFARLVRACSKPNSSTNSDLDRVTIRVYNLYKIRNVFAHGQLSVAHFAEPGSVDVTYRDQLQHHEIKRFPVGDKPRRIVQTVRYTFTALEDILAEQMSVSWALGSLVGGLDHFGPPLEAPQKPS